jgi:hypothetical protein
MTERLKRYFGRWKAYEDVRTDFDEPLDFPDDENILFAWYDREDYDGSAVVIYREGDQLFEVGASHCSCFGLEGQWSRLGEVTPESLAMRPEWDDYRADNEARGAWQALIRELNK